MKYNVYHQVQKYAFKGKRTLAIMTNLCFKSLVL